MDELLREMKRDVESDDSHLVREFALLSSKNVRFSSGKARFVYYKTEHPQLREKAELLVDRRLVQDVTPGNTPIYRMSDAFIAMLKAWKPE